VIGRAVLRHMDALEWWVEMAAQLGITEWDMRQ
jgi:hypothetical protein